MIMRACRRDDSRTLVLVLTIAKRGPRRWCWSRVFHGLHQRPRLFVLDRLDHVPRFIEHLNFGGTIAGALPCVAERWIACAFIAANRANALSLEKFPAALFLPARISRRSNLNDSGTDSHRIFTSTITSAPVLAKSVYFSSGSRLLCASSVKRILGLY